MDRPPRHRRAARAERSRLTLACAALLLGGCGVGDGAGDATGDGCSVAALRGWVEASMRDYYLFADRVPRPRLADFDTPDALLEALRVDPPDRYSYIADEADYDALFEQGETFGFGWRLVRTDETTWLLALIEPGSPLDAAGVRRGDRLVAIDGLAMSEFVALPVAERDRRLGYPNTPVEVELTLERPDGGRFVASVSSAAYALRTVLETRIVEHAGARVGYLPFTQFLETSNAELDTAFATLAAAGIEELVLDLRFNGGGRVDVASALAAAIGGGAVSGETFAAFRHNDRYAASLDFELGFVERFAPLDLARVLVLTGSRTCSASELVVNGLAPFVEVVSIGAPSCGKPFGTAPNRSCGRVLNALEVAFENARGVGGYTEGLPVVCEIADHPRGPLAAAGDALWEGALGYIANGLCPAPATTLAAGDGGEATGAAVRARTTAAPSTDPLERPDPLRESAVF